MPLTLRSSTQSYSFPPSDILTPCLRAKMTVRRFEILMNLNPMINDLGGKFGGQTIGSTDLYLRVAEAARTNKAFQRLPTRYMQDKIQDFLEALHTCSSLSS